MEKVGRRKSWSKTLRAPGPRAAALPIGRNSASFRWHVSLGAKSPEGRGCPSSASQTSRIPIPIDRTLPVGASHPVLEAVGLSRSFGPIEVLSDVSIDVRAGQVHAIIGENGAGKSTLMKIFGGHLSPTRGALKLDGAPVELAGPVDAERRGIVLVHQEIMLAPDLTIAENMFLGREARRGLDGRRPGDEPARGGGAEGVRRRCARRPFRSSGCRSPSGNWRRSPGR